MSELSSKPIHLFTFGGGSFNYRRSAKRLATQAEISKKFSTVNYFTDHTLDQIIPTNKAQHRNFIKSNDRGFGYWLWKPFLVSYALKIIPQGEVLLYLDSGSELNFSSKSANIKWDQYIRRAYEYGSLAFRLNNTNSSNPVELRYSKKFLIDFLEPSIANLNSNQIQAGCFFLKNTHQNIEFVQKWIQVATLNDYKYLNDSLSSKENKTFIDHRHDQSIFSLLYKDLQMFYLNNETDWRSNPIETDWRSNPVERVKYPIWCTRNRSGISRGPIATNDFLDRIYNFFRVSFLHFYQFFSTKLKRSKI
jgi:hypothetical protein